MQEGSEKLGLLLQEVGKVIVGQELLKRDIIIALLSGGHILLEGAPGLAKTKTVESFTQSMKLVFSRIQFTPDLLPSDLIGSKIYDPDAKQFSVKKGPVFGNFILADEINRAPSKVQSALLEAMQERQVTIGEETFPLPSPFMVLATQNPLEQEGTYRLPEAQLDRFLLKTIVEYPSISEEKEIITRAGERELYKIKKIIGKKDIDIMKNDVDAVEVSQSIYDYICNIVFATRNTSTYDAIEYGASPRASLALLRCSKALAFIAGRSYIIPEDIKDIAPGVLRHRIILSYEAQAREISSDDVISQILNDIRVD